MRMTDKQYSSLLSAQKASSQPGTKSQPKKIKTAPEDRASHLDLIKGAAFDTHYVPGRYFYASFAGAKVFSLNELLRLDMRLISGYRKAMHDAARCSLLSATAPSPKPVPFSTPVKVTLHRVGKKLVDNDGLAASFKFLIDGYKEAGLILDDNPKCVSEIILAQDLGDYKISIKFESIAETNDCFFW